MKRTEYVTEVSEVEAMAAGMVAPRRDHRDDGCLFGFVAMVAGFAAAVWAVFR